jgi:hypothetical protein
MKHTVKNYVKPSDKILYMHTKKIIIACGINGFSPTLHNNALNI